MKHEIPLEVTEYKTQAEENNELGRKILALYQEIDRLKDAVNYWREKYETAVSYRLDPEKNQ